MFSATITGQIQRIIYDNKKDGSEAMVKVVLAVPKQYVPKDSDQTHIFPVVTVFGYDADYLRKYAGKGQIISAINCEADYYKNDRFEDEDGNNPDTVSFTTRTVMFTKKAVMEALIDAGIAEPAEGADDDDDDSTSRSRKRKSSGKSRSERRGSSSRRRRRDEDDEDWDDEDDDEEEEKSARRGKSSSKSSSRKTSSRRKKKEDDYDDDYDDDDYDDDDDDYFDDED